MNFKSLLLITLAILSLSFSASASTVKPLELDVAHFDDVYETTTKAYEEVIQNTPQKLLRTFRHHKGNTHVRLSKDQVLLKQKYKRLKAHKRQIDPIYKMREDLKNLYLEKHPSKSVNEKELHHEATTLAVKLFAKIHELKDQYNSMMLPVVHNMMIDIGVRKRGACKHWAEDLLNFMKGIDRKYFYVAWGEAHMKKITEHNVAVIVPVGRPFKEGMMVDPWRTAGRPFWLKLKDDKHYEWQHWLDFGEY